MLCARRCAVDNLQSWYLPNVVSRCSFVFVDTPGQIEVFTWSASGSIITELLASKYPTCIVYVVDTPRSTNPTTFMANMLYACRCVGSGQVQGLCAPQRIIQLYHAH